MDNNTMLETNLQMTVLQMKHTEYGDDDFWMTKKSLDRNKVKRLAKRNMINDAKSAEFEEMQNTT